MVCPWYGWFIDYCLLNVKTQTCHAYSWRKQVQQYKNNYTEVKEEWENRSNDFRLALEMYRELHRREQMYPSVAATMRMLCFVVCYRGLWRTWSVANTLLAMIYGQISRIYNLTIAYSFWYTTSLHSMHFKTTICFTCILLPLQSLAVASFLGILKGADFLLWLWSLIHFLPFES